MKSDARFPTTQATWISLQLDAIEDAPPEPRAAGERALREHVMRRYYEPLSGYLATTSYRDIDAPAAVVAGYFVERLADAGGLRAWRRSGLPLRRWLVNGLLFWARSELRRRRARRRREVALDGAGGALVDGAATPDAVFEREWARALVAGACEVVERELHAAGATDRWEIFARHVLDGRSYDEIARERGCLPADARNATRMVRARIDRALGRMLREEGLPSAEIAEEIRRIHGYFAQGGG